MVVPARPAQAVWRRRERGSVSNGQALVEFALVVPVLLMLLVGLGDWARLYTTAISVESAARDAALFGGFDSSYWLEDNVAKTILTGPESMQDRACVATRHLVDYAGAADGSTCTNPVFVDESGDPIDLASIPTQQEALDAGLLIRPTGMTDCAAPPTDESHHAVCQVRVRLKYTFQMILGGIGIPGLIQFPDTFDIYREVVVPVNDFPEAMP